MQKIPTEGWDDAKFIQLVNRAVEILAHDSDRAFHDKLVAKAYEAPHYSNIKKIAVVAAVAFVVIGVTYAVYKANN